MRFISEQARLRGPSALGLNPCVQPQPPSQSTPITVHSSKTKQRGSRSFVASETWVFPGLDLSLEAELAMAGAVVGAAFGSASVPRQ